MHEIEQLKEALRSAGPADWVTAALSAVEEPGMVLCRKSNATPSADSLVRIYTIRLQHCREDIRSHIESLLHGLRALPGSTRISIKPFLSDSRLIGSFWTSGRLIGCITGPPDPPEALLGNVKTATK